MTPTRVNQIAKRQTDALLRDDKATYEQLRQSWRNLADTVRGERVKENVQ